MGLAPCRPKPPPTTTRHPTLLGCNPLAPLTSPPAKTAWRVPPCASQPPCRLTQRYGRSSHGGAARWGGRKVGEVRTRGRNRVGRPHWLPGPGASAWQCAEGPMSAGTDRAAGYWPPSPRRRSERAPAHPCELRARRLVVALVVRQQRDREHLAAPPLAPALAVNVVGLCPRAQAGGRPPRERWTGRAPED
jgi:hypothetical protein